MKVAYAGAAAAAVLALGLGSGVGLQAASAAPTTSFTITLDATDCSVVTVRGDWATPVAGQNFVAFNLLDLKTNNDISAVDAIAPDQTSAQHSFALGSLARGKHRFRAQVAVQQRLNDLISGSKNFSIGCVR